MMVRLGTLAHARAGDKGDTTTLSVIARDPADFERLRRTVTAEWVEAHLCGAATGRFTRFELPGLSALHFVGRGVLGSGVTTSLALDSHGKTLASALLDLELPELELPGDG
ncbi:AtuA-related protein [Inquilinus limosus]|uniref:AtuA-related protein n=1 Tax=Inquilinus limosus TaxID=171674 RepID=UPI003F5CE8D0